MTINSVSTDELDVLRPPALPVVLAIAGSPDDDTDELLRTALGEARNRNAALHVLHVFGRPAGYLPMRGYAYASPNGSSHLGQMGDQTVATIMARIAALGGSASVPITGEAICGRVIAELVDVSMRSSVLVLGSRRRTLLDSIVVGSVGAALAARAHCPVVFVRGMSDRAAPARVIIGISGEASSDSLLAFGFDYAQRNQLTLRAVHCWRPDPLATDDRPPWQYATRLATATVQDVVAAWAKRYPDVAADGVAIMDHTVHGLVEAAGSDALIVVGRQTHHPCTGAVLGSVSQGVLHHAPGYVAVVPTRP